MLQTHVQGGSGGVHSIGKGDRGGGGTAPLLGERVFSGWGSFCERLALFFGNTSTSLSLSVSPKKMTESGRIKYNIDLHNPLLIQ